MGALIIPSIFLAVDKMTSTVKAMGAGIQKNFVAKAEAGLNKVDRIAKKLIPGLGEASKQFLAFASTAAITAAIIGGLNFSYTAIKDYDRALGSLRAVTGLSGEAFKPFGDEIIRVSKVTQSSSIDVAKAFETIGSANSSLLTSSVAMGQMTQAAITLSQAAGEDLQTTAGNLVGVMNQFGLGADQATRSMNVLAAGTLVGAASIPNVAESMKNFGAVANGANISIEQSVALVEVLGTKSIFGAEAGTKLRGSILKLQAAGVGYKTGQFNINEALDDTVKKLKSLKTAKERDAAITKMFGAENVTTGQILLSNVGLFKDWTSQVTGTSQATIQAAEKNATLDASLNQLKNGWITMITGSKDSQSGVAKLTAGVQWLTRNLDDVVYYTLLVGKAYVALRLGILAARTAIIATNIIIGIKNALDITSVALMNKNIYAQRAYFATTKIMVAGLYAQTAAQWLLNVAMTANPIGIIIVGIVALIALITLAVVKYNEWGAALLLVMGPLGWIINLIQSFRRNWDLITQSFKEGGILAGLKMIGKVILDSVLMPLEQMMLLIAKITGADWASDAAAGIAKFRKDLGVNVSTEENGDQRKNAPLVSTQVEKQAMMSQMYSESVQRQNVNVDIKTDQENTKVKSDNNIAKVKLSSTMGTNW